MISDYPGYLDFQLMDDSVISCVVELDTAKHTLTLTRKSRKDWRPSFTFQQPASDQLTLDGEMDAHKVHVSLHLLDLNKQFPLLAAKFHWVNEYHVNQ